VSSPADAIPDLERLMRDGLRGVLVAANGPDWLDTAPQSVRQGAARAAATARAKRPGETLRDDWDAVGLSEMQSALRSVWNDVHDALVAVWPDLSSASVDLARLVAYRDKNLHAVGPPGGQVADDETGAMILRLRIGFEGLRRKMANDAGEWWPYIEAVHSNIPEFCRSRATRFEAEQPRLSEGDLIWIEVVGVHPTGAQGRLRYRFSDSRLSGDDSGWVESSKFEANVPRQRDIRYYLWVADVDDLANSDGWVVHASVVPLRHDLAQE
jgi:hypothetical protein